VPSRASSLREPLHLRCPSAAAKAALHPGGNTTAEGEQPAPGGISQRANAKERVNRGGNVRGAQSSSDGLRLLPEDRRPVPA
jgi:hypothetical protein